MGHMIERLADGNYSFAFTGERSAVWHGLGVQVSNDLSPEDMQRKAGLDWNVEKQPLFLANDVETNYSMLVRDTDGRQFDAVPNTWIPTQNSEAFAFFNEFVKAGDMEMDTAGSLYGGKHIFALARIKDRVAVFGDDEIGAYLLFSLPHKYGQKISIRTVMTRVVCANTIAAALGETALREYTQNHRTSFKPERAKEVLGVTLEKLNSYKEAAEFLGAKQASNEDVVDYFKRIFPVYQVDKTKESKKEVSKNAQIAQAVLVNQPGAEYAQGSWWQAFNAVTYMVDHVIGKNEERRFESATMGTSNTLKNKALNLALELAA